MGKFIVLRATHDLRGAHPPLVLGRLHVFMDQLLDLPGMLYIYQVQMGHALIRGDDAHGAHPQDPLAQGHIQLQVPDPVEQHFVAFQIQKAFFAEQAVFTEAVPGKGQWQP